VSPLTGIIAGVLNQSLADGLPVYGARQIYPVAVGPRQNRRVGRPSGAAGKGASDAQARISCLGEAVERYSLGWQGTEPRRRARLAELGDAAIHPAALMNWSARQYAERETWNAANGGFNWVGVPFQEDRAIDWTPVWSLTGQRVRFVPTQFCFFYYRGEPDHEFYRAESNGCASGSTLEEAILQGVLELVERDSCALWWYSRVRRPAIDLDSFDDPFFRRAQAYYGAQGRRLYALDLTSDLGIPVAIAVSHGPAGERIMLGLGAHLDARVAVSRALGELNQMVVLDREEPGETTDPDIQAFTRWLAEATVESQPYLLPDPARRLTAASYSPLGGDDILDDLETCLAAVRRGGLEFLVLDATRPEIGFPAVRAIVPGLRHFWARFGPGRLYDVPAALGWVARPLAEAELNPIPFFF
jgi:ribosomal protein S12 methylthiotransferase accessory factor